MCLLLVITWSCQEALITHLVIGNKLKFKNLHREEQSRQVESEDEWLRGLQALAAS